MQRKEAVKEIVIVWALKLTDPDSNTGPTKCRWPMMTCWKSMSLSVLICNALVIKASAAIYVSKGLPNLFLGHTLCKVVLALWGHSVFTVSLEWERPIFKQHDPAIKLGSTGKAR